MKISFFKKIDINTKTYDEILSQENVGKFYRCIQDDDLNEVLIYTPVIYPTKMHCLLCVNSSSIVYRNDYGGNMFVEVNGTLVIEET